MQKSYEKTTFVNRFRIINMLKEDFKQNNRGKVFFIYANSGVGKSRLCEEVLNDTEPDTIPVKLQISNSKAYSSQDGFYIKELAKAISKNRNNKISFEIFLRDNIKEEDLKKFLFKIAEDYTSKNIILKNTKEVFNKFFQKGSFKEEKIFNVNLSESIRYYIKYIKFCLKKQYFIINIENIQNIDMTSVDCLREVLKESKRFYLLLEYTLDTSSVWTTINELEKALFNGLTNIDIDYEKLDFLSLKNLKKVLQSNQEALNHYIETSYQSWNGNLRPLVDMHVKLSKNTPSDVENYVLNAKYDINHFELNDLISLDKNKLFLLQLISVHSDPVDFYLLDKIYSSNLNYQFYELNLDLVELKKRRFINEYNNLYFINDDTIESSLQNFKPFKVSRDQAIIYWLRLYESLYREDSAFISKSQILYYRLDFSMKIKKEDYLLKIIDELFFLFKNSTYTWIDTWISKILDLTKETQDKGIKNTILIRLSEIMQNLGFSRWAYILINEVSTVSTVSTSLLIRKAILLEDLSKPFESIEILKSIPIEGIDDKLFLYKKAVEIACYRSMNNYKVAKKIFFKLIKKNYNLTEIAFVLRQAGFILEESESIPYIEKSISIFKENNLVIQETHSIIALAFVYIKLKNYNIAKQQLLNAQKLVKNNFIEKYIIINNLATINIYKGEDLKETLKSLKELLSSVQLHFDILTIHVNILLVLALLEEEHELIKKQFFIIHQLCQKKEPFDKEIRRRAYFNMVIISNNYQDIDSFKFYKNEFYKFNVNENLNNMDELINTFMYNKNKQISYNYFIANNLAHWMIEFDSILDNYQLEA